MFAGWSKNGRTVARLRLTGQECSEAELLFMGVRATLNDGRFGEVPFGIFY